jgi:hypothetical protein
MVATKQNQRDAVARAMKLAPELALVSAMLRQLLEDAQSPRDHIREEAQHFLKNTKYVAYWDHFLGLDGRLIREAAAPVGQGQDGAPGPCMA